VKIDLNCDLGEGCGNDAALMPLVTSANIACGYHAGDEDTMRTTVRLAVENGVAIGAHPSYPDRENFGRRPMDLSISEVGDLVTRQITQLAEIGAAEGARLTHVKPHGALYNQGANDHELAAAIASAVRSVDESLILFGLAGSALIDAGLEAGLRTAAEVFADRTYRADGRLTPRTENEAVIQDTPRASQQVLQMVLQHKVTATDGTAMSINAETICIHGDGDNAVAFATAIRQALLDNHVEIAAFN